MDNDNINNYIPSLLNPRSVLKTRDMNFTQNSIVSCRSLSLKRNHTGFNISKKLKKTYTQNKENVNNKDIAQEINRCLSQDIAETTGFSAIEDLESINEFNHFSPDREANHIQSDDTVIYEIEKPVISLSLCFNNSKNIDVKAKKLNIKAFSVSHENNNTNIICKLTECSRSSSEGDRDNIENIPLTSPKDQTMAVNLEITRKKAVSNDHSTEESNVLILKTNAIDKLSHVIVQPPNYKFVKRNISYSDKLKTSGDRRFSSLGLKNEKVSVCGDSLKQTSIDDYFYKKLVVHGKKFVGKVHTVNLQYAKPLMPDDVKAMNENSGVNDILKSSKVRATSYKVLRENDMQSRSKLYSPKKDNTSQIRQQEIKASSSEVPRSISPKIRNGSISSFSPRRNLDSLHFSLPSKTKSSKSNAPIKNIPFYKIVAGTHFAVDAFSYGEIPNVNNYFLTHFHSDHYSGLKRTFNKSLFCSKITADLCISRLGVNPRYVQVINIDETIKIDGIDVTAVDANHCPGSIMLVFTLPNGKTLLHTGDFRASPVMESFPVFWNKDMHTIYLDTTYCNPRYDFPTQDQSLGMALQLLREKKTHLEEAGKKFSSVLIVCGTYTIGKEKFFLGIARRVGCLVWACPEKDRVLQIVEGRSFGRAAPHHCQLHVVPMRELTHEKLRAYLDSLQGAFSEVVAFKPSGWENGKNSAVMKDSVTIHGIPYSEHSSFSELIRFVKFLKPKQVVPTVDITGGVKTVQQFFPCPLVYKEDMKCQSRLTDYFSLQNGQQVHAV